ncbi:hypothetical protein EDD15DRAFT_2191502 [Pisolithus albus]|nr:hypothetical protein EDD15DRAFT_2191502 [Pisolithus albus]
MFTLSLLFSELVICCGDGERPNLTTKAAGPPTPRESWRHWSQLSLPLSLIPSQRPILAIALQAPFNTTIHEIELCPKSVRNIENNYPFQLMVGVAQPKKTTALIEFTKVHCAMQAGKEYIPSNSSALLSQYVPIQWLIQLAGILRHTPPEALANGQLSTVVSSGKHPFVSASKAIHALVKSHQADSAPSMLAMTLDRIRHHVPTVANAATVVTDLIVQLRLLTILVALKSMLFSLWVMSKYHRHLLPPALPYIAAPYEISISNCSNYKPVLIIRRFEECIKSTIFSGPITIH